MVHDGSVTKRINQTKHICIAPYVANELEPHDGKRPTINVAKNVKARGYPCLAIFVYKIGYSFVLFLDNIRETFL